MIQQLVRPTDYLIMGYDNPFVGYSMMLDTINALVAEVNALAAPVKPRPSVPFKDMTPEQEAASSILVIFDPAWDNYRAVTQADVDGLVQIRDAYRNLASLVTKPFKEPR